MKRRFNTAGPCRPDLHYMVPAESRLPEAPGLVAQMDIFVVHAPRQIGKTTALRAVAERLTASGRHAAVLFSCEEGAAAGDDYGAAQRAVLRELARAAQIALPPELQPPPFSLDGDEGGSPASSPRRPRSGSTPRPGASSCPTAASPSDACSARSPRSGTSTARCSPPECPIPRSPRSSSSWPSSSGWSTAAASSIASTASAAGASTCSCVFPTGSPTAPGPSSGARWSSRCGARARRIRSARASPRSTTTRAPAAKARDPRDLRRARAAGPKRPPVLRGDHAARPPRRRAPPLTAPVPQQARASRPPRRAPPALRPPAPAYSAAFLNSITWPPSPPLLLSASAGRFTREIFSGATPAAAMNARACSLSPSASSSGVPDAMTRPWITTNAWCAMRNVLAMSCEITTLVTLYRARVSSIRSSTIRLVSGSSPLVGSS
ncbi:uncharacterized protein SOCE26_036140 [Sorangium cellulosum]|uniref:Uncharacterized protein n=1 Tax=Sorangium cellulosum TaxID=56 RepID=A0A2L0ES97_SORCE|nr:uncharacterized protein SOCE26_036140 [Sorangium cellulosum]